MSSFSPNTATPKETRFGCLKTFENPQFHAPVATSLIYPVKRIYKYCKTVAFTCSRRSSSVLPVLDKVIMNLMGMLQLGYYMLQLGKTDFLFDRWHLMLSQRHLLARLSYMYTYKSTFNEGKVDAKHWKLGANKCACPHDPLVRY